MLKIPELREKTKKSLGDKFDIRQFHEVLLSNGKGPARCVRGASQSLDQVETG
jgi:uncharacterized protein (DUF885 family)